MKRNNTIRNNSKLYMIYIIGTIIFILVAFLSIKQNVMGREQRKQMDLILSVDQVEQSYLQSVKGELTRHGFINCGVTMTKTVEGEGEFNYRVQIHHKNLDELGLEQKNAIFNSLKTFSTEIEEIINAEDILQEVCFVYEII